MHSKQRFLKPRPILHMGVCSSEIGLVHTSKWRAEDTCYPQEGHPFPLIQYLLLTSNSPVSEAIWPVNARDLSIFIYPVLGLQASGTMSAFLFGFWRSCSVPHICMASILSTDKMFHVKSCPQYFTLCILRLFFEFLKDKAYNLDCGQTQNLSKK